MTTPILKLANVESAYGPIRAIRGVSLDVIQGQIASVLWLLGVYSLAFSGTGPLVGDLAKFGLISVGRDAVTGVLPESVFFAFQMTFAIITPALIVGAFVERIKFSAVLLFSALWLIVVYASGPGSRKAATGR